MKGCGISCPQLHGASLCAAQPRTISQRWDLSSKWKVGWDLTDQCFPVSPTLCWAHELVIGRLPAASEGLLLLTAPTRPTYFHSSPGMLQICGDFVLLPPDVALSCAAGGHAVAAPGRGEGTLCTPLRPPTRAPSSHTWAGCRGWRTRAGRLQTCRKTEVSLVWVELKMIQSRKCAGAPRTCSWSRSRCRRWLPGVGAAPGHPGRPAPHAAAAVFSSRQHFMASPLILLLVWTRRRVVLHPPQGWQSVQGYF